MGRAATVDGGGLYFGTLTLRHNNRQQLPDLIKVLDGGLRRWRSDRNAPLREHSLWERAGVRLQGWALAYEETWSPHAGWHPHAHLLLFTDRYVEGSVVEGEGRELGRELRDLEEWRQRARMAHLRASPLQDVPSDRTPLGRAFCPAWVVGRGIDPATAPERATTQILGADPALCWAWELLQGWVSAVSAASSDSSVVPSLLGLDLMPVVTLRGVDSYLAKVGLELMGSPSKSGRGASLTPHQLLARAVGLDGAAPAERQQARALWCAWLAATKKRRRISWSAGKRSLKALYPPGESEPPPLVAGASPPPPPVVLGTIEPEIWPHIAVAEAWHPDQLPTLAEAEARTLAIWTRAAVLQDAARHPMSADRALELAVEDLAVELAETYVAEGQLWTPALNRALREVDPRRWGLRPLGGRQLLIWTAERQGPEPVSLWLTWLSEMVADYNLTSPRRRGWASRAVQVMIRGLSTNSAPPPVRWGSLR